MIGSQRGHWLTQLASRGPLNRAAPSRHDAHAQSQRRLNKLLDIRPNSGNADGAAASGVGEWDCGSTDRAKLCRG